MSEPEELEMADDFNIKLNALLAVTAQNSAAIDRLTERLDELTKNVDKTTKNIDKLTERIDDLIDITSVFYKVVMAHIDPNDPTKHRS
jgi:prefoldin subunit 5